jgi:hypothetical protein
MNDGSTRMMVRWSTMFLMLITVLYFVSVPAVAQNLSPGRPVCLEPGNSFSDSLSFSCGNPNITPAGQQDCSWQLRVNPTGIVSFSPFSNVHVTQGATINQTFSFTASSGATGINTVTVSAVDISHVGPGNPPLPSRTYGQINVLANCAPGTPRPGTSAGLEKSPLLLIGLVSVVTVLGTLYARLVLM